MNRKIFEDFVNRHEDIVTKIRTAAWALHEQVGQTYDKTLPYGHHLSMVADSALQYGHIVVAREEDILPIIFGAYYHDSMEDARLTYNNVRQTGEQYMTAEQALMAAEIVFALTNDKGRTRAERAGERYYAGIRATPYAPFVKLCDRLANMRYSHSGSGAVNQHMLEVYCTEWPHFLANITVDGEDPRFLLPKEMISVIESMLAKEYPLEKHTCSPEK